MKLTPTLICLLLISTNFVITSCSPSKQEQIELLNQKIKRLNELIQEQKEDKDKRVKKYISEQEKISNEFEFKMKRNLQENMLNRNAYDKANNDNMKWLDNARDSLDKAHFSEYAYFKQNEVIIDSLKGEISKCQIQLDKLIGIK